MNNLETISVVCYANYCRSPVAEKILAKKYEGRYKVISSGINPIARSGMDPRSIRWLENNNYTYTIHEPTKVTSLIVKKSSIIFCLDAIVLIQLNKMFPRDRDKIKCLNFQMPKIKLNDPYHFNSNDYYDVMDKIKDVCLGLTIR